MNNLDTFFSLIDIKDDEIDSAKEFIRLRGLEEHIMMAKYLSSHKEKDKPTYSEVATAFRYDKRIRRIVYKYIGLIEEYYRSYLCNNYSSPKELNIQTNKTLYEYCSNSLFSKIVDIVWSLDNNHKTILFESNTVLKKNLEALVRFRNAISHNRTLVNYRDFKEVTLDNGEIGCSLLLNIKNLLYLLPDTTGNSFVQEINSASRVGPKKLSNQTEWALEPYLVIKL